MKSFVELSHNEMEELNGGIGILASIAIGALCLGGGIGVGYGVAWLLS